MQSIQLMVQPAISMGCINPDHKSTDLESQNQHPVLFDGCELRDQLSS